MSCGHVFKPVCPQGPMSPRNSPEELPKPLAGNMLNKVFFLV